MFPLRRLSGRGLRALATAIRTPPLRLAIAASARAALGIDLARALSREHRGPLPATTFPLQARTDQERASLELSVKAPGAWPRTCESYRAAYSAGRTRPQDVAARALRAARELALLTPSLGPLCGYDDEAAAAAGGQSATRIAQGRPLSDADGVPFVVKEELDLRGFPTRLGTSFLPYFPAETDAAAVARLRERGAIPIGQTPMTEYGLSPLGVNAKRHLPRNAHDPRRMAGGSSVGSAVAVALGLAPFAFGTDGGGSVRVPAAYNGIFSIKPTYGRIPLVGHGMPGSTSLVHVGILAASSVDLAFVLESASGYHAGDELTTNSPALKPGSLFSALRRGVRGLRVGVDEDEWLAAADDVSGPARAALDALTDAGAEIVPIKLRMAPHAAAIGYLTISLEAHVGLADVQRHHFDELGYDVQILLGGLASFRADDYVDAQRLRNGLRLELKSTLQTVDVIALPTTANAAPAVNDREMQSGILDPDALGAACRFAFLANLSGLPAASAPIGSDADGLPVGIQIVGDAWDEACVLQVLAELERAGAAQVMRPKHAVDLLAD